MKHTDRYDILRKIDEQDRRELMAAVEAHGGEFCFGEGKGYCIPRILSTGKHWEAYDNVDVLKVAIEDGCLCVYGKTVDWPGDVVLLEHIVPGQIGYIIDAIPETATVKDVSEPKHRATEIESISNQY